MAMVMVHSQEDELTAKRDLLLLDALNDHVDIDVDVDVDVVFPFPTCCTLVPLRELSTTMYGTMYNVPVPVPVSCVVVVEL